MLVMPAMHVEQPAAIALGMTIPHIITGCLGIDGVSGWDIPAHGAGDGGGPPPPPPPPPWVQLFFFFFFRGRKKKNKTFSFSKLKGDKNLQTGLEKLF